MSDLDKLKQLRAETDVSYSKCKEALDEAGGDIDKAREILRKKGAEVAAKKADRETSQGAVFSYIHHNSKVGAMVTLHSETDFVAMNDEFKKLGNEIAMQVASTNPAKMEDLLDMPFIRDPKITIGEYVKDHILKLGENITVGNFTRFEI